MTSFRYNNSMDSLQKDLQCCCLVKRNSSTTNTLLLLIGQVVCTHPQLLLDLVPGVFINYHFKEDTLFVIAQEILYFQCY